MAWSKHDPVRTVESGPWVEHTASLVLLHNSPVEGGKSCVLLLLEQHLHTDILLAHIRCEGALQLRGRHVIALRGCKVATAAFTMPTKSLSGIAARRRLPRFGLLTQRNCVKLVPLMISLGLTSIY